MMVHMLQSRLSIFHDSSRCFIPAGACHRARVLLHMTNVFMQDTMLERYANVSIFTLFSFYDYLVHDFFSARSR